MENTNIKTCEEYVVKRITDVEGKLGESYNLINEQLKEIEKLNKVLESIFKRLHLKTTKDEDRYIEFDTVWEDYDKDMYDSLLGFLNS